MSYGKVEKHRMHDFWFLNALKQLAEVVRRAPKDPTVKKVPGRKAPEWPGYMGKHHAIIEDLLRMDVVSLHQDSGAETFARVHNAALQRAITEVSAAAAAADATASTVPSSALSSSGAQLHLLPRSGGSCLRAHAAIVAPRWERKWATTATMLPAV